MSDLSRKHACLLSCSTLVALFIATLAFAGEARCDRCGCSISCERTCRLVCEDRKVSKICWGYKCEEFCAPGPSTQGCEHCEMACEDCQKKESKEEAPSAKPQKFVWREWHPAKCAKVFTRAKLMKKTETKTVPGYKWVVEDLCPACQATCEVVAKPIADAVIPPMPDEDAKILGPAVASK